MARDTANAAKDNSRTAQTLSSSLTGRAGDMYSVLAPTLTRMATNPQGFSQGDINNMNTAALQSTAGAAAGQTGAALQRSAATNNAGASTGLVSAANQDATRALSDAALGVQNRNALLKEQQRQEGLSGLEGLYGENIGGGENALGLSNNALQVRNQANQNGWLQNTLGVINTLRGPNYA